MVTKTKRKIKRKARSKTKGNGYVVVSGGRVKTITARNIQEAYAKAGRLFPKASIITVRRKPARTGKEYETYIISR